eukprot:TRINITY_DN40_c1_g1_i12.p1 TRINITY_DN40_c1_g1~~TRINITY_DN40_c1_g1_i12.p1  ORF type:complete len:212 (+),score=26.43 TRINITY_DN40_c1_g1_i12:1343-1978(+)
MNQALLGKWLCEIGDSSQGLWRQVLEMKYKLPRHGWDVQDHPGNSSAIWKGILSIKGLFMENIRYQTGSGERILFWKDRWVGKRALCVQFPDLFRCAQDKEATVSSYMSITGDQRVWCPIFRRNLKDNEESQFFNLLNSLNSVTIQDSRIDDRVWTTSKNGSFLVSSFFKTILNNPRDRTRVYGSWKMKAPPRVLVFWWLLLGKGSLLWTS